MRSHSTIPAKIIRAAYPSSPFLPARMAAVIPAMLMGDAAQSASVSAAGPRLPPNIVRRPA